jgi:CDP-glucose 4,6-dehydratase
LDAGQALKIRSPLATRPWQHVLEPLAGYLALAEKLCVEGEAYAEAWNFGPEEADTKAVQWIVEHLCAQVPGTRWEVDGEPQPHEAHALKLDSSKAKALIGWRPRWDLAVALDKTLAWHNEWLGGANMAEISLAQIREYEATERP